MNLPQKYYEQTEHAARQLIKNLNFYDELLDKGVIVSPFWADNENWNDKAENWYKENQDKIENSGDYLKEFAGSQISRDVISGSLLQIAYMGLKLYAPKIPINKLPALINEKIDKSGQQYLAKFSHGRKVWNLPIGLIVYASRNQYNHFEDKSYNTLTQTIVDEMTKHDPMIPEILKKDEARSISYRVVEKLGWKYFRNFENDIKDLISF